MVDSVRRRGSGEGMGRNGVGLGSGVGGSSSIGKVAGFLLRFSWSSST